MTDMINILLVRSHESAVMRRIKNTPKEFEKILKGQTKERIKEVAYGAAYKKITSEAIGTFILVNVNENDENRDMDIQKAYEILFHSGNMVNIRIDESVVDEHDWEHGVFSHHEVKIKPVLVNMDIEVTKVEFTFYDDNIQLIGKSSMVLIDTADFDGNIIDELKEKSGPISLHLSGIEEYDSREEATNYYGGVSGKVAIVESFFIGGPYNNPEALEVEALTSAIGFLEETIKTDFIVLNPEIVNLKSKNHLTEIIGFENTTEPTVLLENKRLKVENPAELLEDYVSIQFRIKLLERIALDDSISLEEKGLLLYYALDTKWSIEELFTLCFEKREVIADVLNSLINHGLLVLDGKDLIMSESLIKDINNKTTDDFTDLVDLDVNDSALETEDEIHNITSEELASTQYEVLLDSRTAVSIDVAYLGKEEYQKEMRPHLVKNMLMTRRMSLTEKLPYNSTPLMVVVFHKDKDMAKAILENFNEEDLFIEHQAENDFGHTALSIAVRNNDLDIIGWLLEAGFPLKSKSVHRAVLATAVLQNYEQVFTLLINHAKKQEIDIRDEIKEILNSGIIDENTSILNIATDYLATTHYFSKGSRYQFNIKSVKKQEGYFLLLEESGIELRWGTKRTIPDELAGSGKLTIKATIKQQLRENCYEVNRVRFS